jgi:hypothetical protein
MERTAMHTPFENSIDRRSLLTASLAFAAAMPAAARDARGASSLPNSLPSPAKREPSPFTGKYYKLHDKGLYRCICCGNALFSSDTKFESGTGWPSFWAPIAKENVAEETDRSLGMERTEVLCRKCDAHLGTSSRTARSRRACATV